VTQPDHNEDIHVDRDPRRIEAMFGAIVPRYDLMNRLMTAGLDGRWRRMAAAEAGLTRGDRALDVCCGTGDLTFALADACPACEVTGLDFTEAMLERAREKARWRRWKAAKGRWQAARRRRRVTAGEAAEMAEGKPKPPDFIRGDVLALPFGDGEFAAVTVGWGVRNLPDLDRALHEMARVTRAGGRVVILESTRPPAGLGRRFHAIWFERVVPLLGRLVAGAGSAYEYLPASVRDFPDADGLAARMAAAGLVGVRYRRLGFGAVALHVGEVPR
jgi:demethylmenaquinone methyltransferase / 2-methoxy-6-polyprenyl-1,4-benzoquinol methylase